MDLLISSSYVQVLQNSFIHFSSLTNFKMATMCISLCVGEWPLELLSKPHWSCFHCCEWASLGKASTAPAIGVWLISSDWLEMVSPLCSINPSSHSHLALKSARIWGSAKSWCMCVCLWVCVLMLNRVREWMIHSGRQTKLNGSCTHVLRQQTLTPNVGMTSLT